MRTARELFQATPNFAHYQTFLASAGFDAACHAALNELVCDLPLNVTDPSRSWDNYLLILGARKFIEKFSQLNWPATEPKPFHYPELNTE
jgi:hypothetical protein